ncbi:glutamate cyclase domain-containing protein [Chelatococcus sp. GCM10030263]|uniref:glutamate cyclase domain-containing protein n=1 Tax=Chelatococcus sp. GCM10030263 TaxID=3273387 RepID=UPI003623873E
MAAAAEDRVLTIAAANIDRLTTVEMRRSDYSRGVITHLHAAAVEAQGGTPLSLAGARLLKEKVVPGRTVLITTGAGDPRYLPAGETDGPPGAAVLARLVAALGGTPILLTEAAFVDNLAATALGAGLGIRSPELADGTPWTTAVLALSAGDDAAVQAAELLDRFNPTLLISIEKIGPNPAGSAHSASGSPTHASRARAEYLFDLGRERGLPSLGIGDNGNELGFGKILAAVHEHKPKGETLGTRVETDVLVPANASNWGAYGIAAALAILMEQPDLLHSPVDERRMLEACVDQGAVDGSTGRHIVEVDGMTLAAQEGLLSMLGCIVRNALIRGYKRPF